MLLPMQPTAFWQLRPDLKCCWSLLPLGTVLPVVQTTFAVARWSISSTLCACVMRYVSHTPSDLFNFGSCCLAPLIIWKKQAESELEWHQQGTTSQQQPKAISIVSVFLISLVTPTHFCESWITLTRDGSRKHQKNVGAEPSSFHLHCWACFVLIINHCTLLIHWTQLTMLNQPTTTAVAGPFMHRSTFLPGRYRVTMICQSALEFANLASSVVRAGRIPQKGARIEPFG